MHQFERHPAEQVLARRGALAARSRGDGEQGAKSFAARSNEMGGDRIEEGVTEDHRFRKKHLESREIVFHRAQPKSFVGIHLTTLEEHSPWSGRRSIGHV